VTVFAHIFGWSLLAALALSVPVAIGLALTARSRCMYRLWRVEGADGRLRLSRVQILEGKEDE